jgi:hypothetical protein
MKKFFYFLFIACNLSAAFAADDKFVDCGHGYVVAAARARDGIPTVECKKLWCRDLENNKNMGRENTAATGYVATNRPEEIYPGAGLYCFGKRNWCLEDGAFNQEYGIYTKGGADSSLFRSVLSGNCYKWQMQNHNCGPNEVAINDGSAWICVSQSGGTDAARSAVKSKAIRRISISPKMRK